MYIVCRYFDTVDINGKNEDYGKLNNRYLSYIAWLAPIYYMKNRNENTNEKSIFTNRTPNIRCFSLCLTLEKEG